MIDLHFLSDTTLEDVATSDQGHWSLTADTIGYPVGEASAEDCTVASRVIDRTAVAEIKWMFDCVRAIARLRGTLMERPEPDDDNEVLLYPHGSWWIPWLDTDPLVKTTVRISDIRM